MTDRNRNRVMETDGQEQRNEERNKGIHRYIDRDLDSNRRTWTETEGWKMEMEKGTERGI